MSRRSGFHVFQLVILSFAFVPSVCAVDEKTQDTHEVVKAARIDGIGPDWRSLGKSDFSGPDSAYFRRFRV